MPRVILKGHAYTFPVSDLLTLFTGKGTRMIDNQIICGDDDIRIISEINEREISTRTHGGQVICSDVSTLKLPFKREVKRQLYFILSQVYNRTFPWGSLTGIRPTLVASELGNAQQMEEIYYVQSNKADLAVRVAAEENRILHQIPVDSYSVYIGIPYCPTRCSYCSFISFDAAGRTDRLNAYAEALVYEIQQFFQLTNISPMHLYVGGGTPSVYDDASFSTLFRRIFAQIPSASLKEITVEVGRADTITRSKLQLLKELGVNRICINPQTTNNRTLERLGRNHSFEDFLRAQDIARDMGFQTINMDLIAGLPGESEADFDNSLAQILSLEPKNITIHTLSKKRSSNLSAEFSTISESSSDPIDHMLAYAHENLESGKYHPYYLYRQKNTFGGHENTGYSMLGHDCSYNVAMMSDCRSVIGFGAGSISKRIREGERLERCPNVKNPEDYIKRVKEMSDNKIAFFVHHLEPREII